MKQVYYEYNIKGSLGSRLVSRPGASIDRSKNVNSELARAFTGLHGKYIVEAPLGSVTTAALMLAVNAQQGDTRVPRVCPVILNQIETCCTTEENCHENSTLNCLGKRLLLRIVYRPAVLFNDE